MSKILICCADKAIRERVKDMLSDHYEMILTDSIEQTEEVLKHSKIKLLLIEIPLFKSFQSKNPSIKAFPIERPIKAENLLSICDKA